MTFDLLTITCIGLFGALALITWLSEPKRSREPNMDLAMLCVLAGTMLAYVSNSLPLFTLGWAITIVPYWRWYTGPRTMLTAGTVALAAGAILSGIPDQRAHVLSFGALMLAAMLRKGIFPAHSWVPNGLDQSPPALLMLLLNGHLGGFLVVRYAIPMMADVASQALPLLSYLALFTALYAAFLALAETRIRRVLGFLCVSQASFVLAGLENRNTEGVTGALVHWFVVTTATTGLVCVYRALEARYPVVAEPQGYLGLGSRTPRLATFFAICGLALVGLPGTLGFAAEDLLFHGSLESHPLLGLTLPIATALNGITIYRVFARLFMGRPMVHTPDVPDALPGERWSLSAAAVFLIAGGILPSVLVTLRTPAAERIVQLLGVQ